MGKSKSANTYHPFGLHDWNAGGKDFEKKLKELIREVIKEEIGGKKW